MHHFRVPDMSCGHCVKAITSAIHDLDGAAKVEADPATKQVTVISTFDARALAAAIGEAGYTVEVRAG